MAGLSPPKRSAAGIGHDHPCLDSCNSTEPFLQIECGTHGIRGEQDDVLLLDVALIDPCPHPYMAAGQLREDKGILQEDLL